MSTPEDYQKMWGIQIRYYKGSSAISKDAFNAYLNRQMRKYADFGSIATDYEVSTVLGKYHWTFSFEQIIYYSCFWFKTKEKRDLFVKKLEEFEQRRDACFSCAFSYPKVEEQT